MQTGGVLTVEAALPSSRYNTNQKKMEFYLQLETALRRLPGIRAVGLTDSVPPGGWQGEFRYSDLVVQGKPRTPPGTGGRVVSRFVTPDYFAAMKIPVLRGRSFGTSDNESGEKVALINATLARKYWSGEDPIGKRIGSGFEGKGNWVTVVGVVGDIKQHGLGVETRPEMYRPYFQHTSLPPMTFMVRTSSTPTALAASIRSAVWSIDKNVPMTTRDGVTLRADVYRPDGTGRFPVLLSRLPYDKSLRRRPGDIDVFVERGYVVIMQDTRGRFASDGDEYYPLNCEGQDGYDAVEWAAGLPYADGQVGTMGQSYLGATQYLLAPERPPHLKAAFPVSAAADFHQCWTYHTGGAFELGWQIPYALLMARDSIERRGLTKTLLPWLKQQLAPAPTPWARSTPASARARLRNCEKVTVSRSSSSIQKVMNGRSPGATARGA